MIDFNNDTIRPLSRYAKKFNVSYSTIRNWRKDHSFPAFRIAGGWYSSDETVSKWMVEQQSIEQTRGKHLQEDQER